MLRRPFSVDGTWYVLYTALVIKSYGNKHTENLWNGNSPRPFRAFARQAIKRLRIINRAINLRDLQLLPGNRLEALTGDRKGQYSVRINGQWRICFRWSGNDAFDVEIVDYHKG